MCHFSLLQMSSEALKKQYFAKFYYFTLAHSFKQHIFAPRISPVVCVLML